MRIARCVAAIVLVGTLGTTTAACTPIHCWGTRSGAINSSDLAPQVLWNTTDWFASHPTSRLRVCVNETCQSLTSSDANFLGVLGLIPEAAEAARANISDQVFRLTDAGTQAGVTLAFSAARSKMHAWVADAGTCFAQTGYKLNATVASDGSIRTE